MVAGSPGDRLADGVMGGCRVPGGTDVQCAADLAAFYSKARTEGKADVTQVLVKDLRKPPGAPPGMVLVAGKETVIVAFPAKSLAAAQLGKDTLA